MNRRNRFGWVGCIAAAGLVASLAGCASRQSAYTETFEGTGDASTARVQRAEADAHWTKRGEESELRAAIEGYEAVVAADPSAKDVLIRLSRAYYLLGASHLAGDEREDERIAAHDTGAKLGERALALNPEFKKLVASGMTDVEALSAATPEDVGAIYWAWSNLGRWANEQGFATILKYKDKLKKFIDRAVELDPTYFYGGPPRAVAVFYAKAPDFAGGDLDLARQNFEHSLEIEPNYLGTKVLMAEFLATKLQDREMYVSLLGEVLAADPGSIAGLEPEQELEQAKAQRLLDEVDDKFLD